MITFLPLVQLSCAQRHPVRAYSTLHAGEERGGVYSYSSDTVEGPRAPAVKLTARHSSLTRVRAAPLSPWPRHRDAGNLSRKPRLPSHLERERERESFIRNNRWSRARPADRRCLALCGLD